MGVWVSVEGTYKINPIVDDQLIREYIEFSERTCPDSYADEKFYNVWFFNCENELMCHAGKFCEPSIWLRHLKDNFFEPKGYELCGEIKETDECEAGFWEKEKSKEAEYDIWIKRKKTLQLRE